MYQVTVGQPDCLYCGKGQKIDLGLPVYLLINIYQSLLKLLFLQMYSKLALYIATTCTYKCKISSITEHIVFYVPYKKLIKSGVLH